MSEKSTWAFHDMEPIYMQLANQLIEKILAGYYHSGIEFPPIRKLAQEAGVNTNTAERAYRVLYDGKFIVKQKRKYQVNMSPEFITAKRYEVATTHVTNCMCHLIALGYSKKELRELRVFQMEQLKCLKAYDTLL